MNGRFPTAVHIMTVLASATDPIPSGATSLVPSGATSLVSSGAIAESLNVNPALVRKELSNLIANNLVKSHEGKNGGYALAKPASKIALSDIYQAVKPDAILGVCKNQPNPECRIGKQINKHINKLYEAVDHAVITELGDTTLLTFSKQFK